MLLVLGGCNIVGPWSVEQGRMRYNEVILKTAQEQLLLNVVRASHNEQPLFMDVAEVDSQLSFTGSLSSAISGLGIGKKNVTTFRMGSLTSATLTPGVSYTEDPVIRYIPLQGQALVQQLATPLPVEVLPQMFDSDLPLPTILDFVADRLTPAWQDYYPALNLLGQLDFDGALTIAAEAPAEGRGTGQIAPAAPARTALQIYAAPPAAPARTALQIYFHPGGGKCDTIIRDAALWAQLLGLYDAVRTDVQRKALSNLRALTDKLSQEKLSKVPASARCPEMAKVTAAAAPVQSLELRNEALKAAAAGGETRAKPNDTAPYLRLRSAYGILRSVDVSDYAPDDLIEVVTPSGYRRIKQLPWNNGQQFYLMTHRAYCGGTPIPPDIEELPPINKIKCRNLAPVATPKIIDHVDRAICDWDPPAALPSQPSMSSQAREATDRREQSNDYRKQACGLNPLPVKKADAENTAPLLTLVDGNSLGTNDEASMKERLLGHLRRYILIIQSADAPDAAFVSTKFDDGYYYIAADDYISQKNFRFLSLISTMQSVAPAAPLSSSISLGTH